MHEVEEVQVTVRLPKHVAQDLRRVQEEDPRFIDRIMLYGLTRRSIYTHLRKGPPPPPAVPDPGRDILSR